MNLDALLENLNPVRRCGPDCDVHGVEYDSRKVGQGSVFVAMRGQSTDGNCFIPQAIAQGATAIVTDSRQACDDLVRSQAHHPSVAAIEVTHGRRALAVLAANFFRHPEAELKLAGITGTNGKTTTAFLLDAMLRGSGRETVLASTIEIHVAGHVVPAPHTTPESRDLLELFREGVDEGAAEAVMEASSHALDQDRVYGFPFDVAVFTNLTRDHLDYHHDMQSYFAAKARLFDGSEGRPPRVAVINQDSEYGNRLAAIASSAGVSVIYRYGLSDGDFHAADLTMAASGMSFRIIGPREEAWVETRLTGRVNVSNILAASAAAVARGLTLDEAAQGAASLLRVPGRFESVACGQDFAVIVDYAHTDDALANVLAMAREFTHWRGGRVIVLFGCGGDRDRTKRPLMGRAAGLASDLVVLTSDNPRSEDPGSIIQEILPGLRETGTTYIVEPDRAAAIRRAIGEAQSGDLVLLAGKGHERFQIFGNERLPFDDAAVARDILEERAQEGQTWTSRSRK